MHLFLGTAAEWKALEELARTWDFWSLAEIQKTLQSRRCLVSYLESEEERQGRMAAFAFCLAEAEAELLYLFVDESFRGRGFARSLLLETMGELKDRFSARAIHLEVRASNQAALAVYNSCGFSLIGRRRRYYQDGEDALLMRCLFLAESPTEPSTGVDFSS